MEKRKPIIKDEELNKLLEKFKDLKVNVDKNISEIIEAAKVLETIKIKKNNNKKEKEAAE